MPPATQAIARSSSPARLLGSADAVVLRALWRYHFLTAQQVCRLRYAAGSLTYVQTILKRLVDAGYLHRSFLPRPTQHGSAPSVYSLASRGRAYVDHIGLLVPRRYRPSEERRHSYLFLDHTLAINDILITFELLARGTPDLELAAVLHERVLQHQPIRVVDATGRPLTLIPDAWLDVHWHGEQSCLWVEVDRATEEQKRWRKKVRGLLTAVGGAYQARFATTSLTVLVVVPPGTRRLEELLRWTEAELTGHSAAAADIFRFAALDAAVAIPAETGLAPVWIRPGDRAHLSLLEQNQGGNHAHLAA